MFKDSGIASFRQPWVSEGKEHCKVNKDVEARLSESGSDDNLEKFLSNLKLTSKLGMDWEGY